MTYETKITRARFVVSRFTAAQMVRIGTDAIASIKERLARGENVSDQPAAPLKEGPARKDGRPSRRSYKARKERKGLPGIRDWKFTGETLDAMNVISANENRAVISFSDPVAAMRAAIQNKRERQFGLSDRNWDAVKAAVKRERIVRAMRVA